MDILLALLLCISCFSNAYESDEGVDRPTPNGSSNKLTVDNDLPKFEGKTFQLLICSANVHGFSDPNAKDIFQELDKLKRDNDDIVVIGLQECYKNPTTVVLSGYKVFAASCTDNAIFVLGLSH